MRAKDLTGLRCGRLTVLERAERKSKQARWLCECECGSEKVVWQSALVRGDVRSCGCLLRERYRSGWQAVAKEIPMAEQARAVMRRNLEDSGVPLMAFDWARRAWS